MNSSPHDHLGSDPSLRFLLREGEMRRRIREHDWQDTVLGSPHRWPRTLKTALSIMLDSATASYLAWGPHYYQFYNDAYISILGPEKHAQAIGKTTPETWQEIWDFVGPLFAQVCNSGQAVSMENQLLPMLRNGYLEECYFSFSYSPLTDEEGEVNGVFATVWETTREFVSNRRKNALRLLVQRLAQTEEILEVHRAFEETIRDCSEDLPFGLWYAQRPDSADFELVAAAGIEPGSELAPASIGLQSPGFYAGRLRIHQPQRQACDLDEKLFLSPRAQSRARVPQQVILEPVVYGSRRQADAYIVLGVNPMRPYDEAQQEFLQSIPQHLENTVRRISRLLLDRREQAYQFEAVMSVLPCLVWLADSEQRCTFVNQAWLDFTGRGFQEEIGDGWIARVHPDDVANVRRHCDFRMTPPGEAFEFRLLDAQGCYRWVLGRAVPRQDSTGQHLGSIGTFLDITDRKTYEQMIVCSQKELHILYDHLQQVREDERRALAREVHDQLGQVLAAAKIDVKMLGSTISGQKRLKRQEILQELQSAQRAIDNSIEIVRRLAHQLRPPELESQGLGSAIGWHLQDFERRTQIACHLDMPQNLQDLELEVKLALFGIFQEALTNILRHAHASRVSVSLRHDEDQLHFEVQDDGIGIAQTPLESATTLGLKGMRERAAAIGARLSVRSAQPSGTVIAVTRARKAGKGDVGMQEAAGS